MRKTRCFFLHNFTKGRQGGGINVSGKLLLSHLDKFFDEIVIISDNHYVPSEYKSFLVKKELPKVTGPKSFFKLVYHFIKNLNKRSSESIDCNNDDITVICNSFKWYLGQIKFYNYETLQKCIILRGDTNSQVFQKLDNYDNSIKAKLTYLGQFNSLVYVSEGIKKNWTSFPILSTKPSFVIQNTISEKVLETIKERRRQGYIEINTFSDQDTNIVLVGTIMDRKGQYLISKILQSKELLESNIIFHIFGKFSHVYSSEITTKFYNDKGNPHVKFYGHKENIYEYIRCADICLNLSFSEAFPRSVLEFIALGKPVIATNTSGSDEMVIHGHNGYLIDVGDFQSCAIFINKLIFSNKSRDEFGRNSEKLYNEKFSEKIHSRKLNMWISKIKNSAK